MNAASHQKLLLAYTQQADDAAFAELVQRHVDLVFGSAIRLLGDRGAAEEVTQKRVAKALDRLTGFFRRHGHGAATAGLAVRSLEAAGTLAPSGLAASVTNAAIGIGAATSLTTFAVLFAKFMSLTKTQTAVV